MRVRSEAGTEGAAAEEGGVGAGGRGAFMPASGTVTLKLQGMFLVRTPTLRPILDHNWFLNGQLCRVGWVEVGAAGSPSTAAAGAGALLVLVVVVL